MCCTVVAKSTGNQTLDIARSVSIAGPPRLRHEFELLIKSHPESQCDHIKKDTCDTGDTIKLKDATTKLLTLARHLLSFYPGTHAKGDAAAKGTGKKK